MSLIKRVTFACVLFIAVNFSFAADATGDKNKENLNNEKGAVFRIKENEIEFKSLMEKVEQHFRRKVSLAVQDINLSGHKVKIDVESNDYQTVIAEISRQTGFGLNCLAKSIFFQANRFPVIAYEKLEKAMILVFGPIPYHSEEGGEAHGFDFAFWQLYDQKVIKDYKLSELYAYDRQNQKLELIDNGVNITPFEFAIEGSYIIEDTSKKDLRLKGVLIGNTFESEVGLSCEIKKGSECDGQIDGIRLQLEKVEPFSEDPKFTDVKILITWDNGLKGDDLRRFLDRQDQILKGLKIDDSEDCWLEQMVLSGKLKGYDLSSWSVVSNGSKIDVESCSFFIVQGKKMLLSFRIPSDLVKNARLNVNIGRINFRQKKPFSISCSLKEPDEDAIAATPSGSGDKK